MVVDFCNIQVLELQKDLRGDVLGIDRQKDVTWGIHLDGSASRESNRIRVVVSSPNDDSLMYDIYLDFKLTNNKAEYEVVPIGLNIIKNV